MLKMMGLSRDVFMGAQMTQLGSLLNRLGAEKLSGNSFSRLKAKFEMNAKSSN